MPYSVYLKKGEEKRVCDGHSWVYANEVARIEGKDKNGSLAEVYSYDGKFIGKGYINHLSKILVRIFIRDKAQDDGEKLYLDRIKAANDLRQSLGFDDCYRMVFGEADDLPALIIDRYGDVFVVQCLSLGINLRKNMIVNCLVKLFSPAGIYERSDVSVRKKEGLEEEKGVLYGEIDDRVLVRENGLTLSVDVINGQKTGYFLDQKENRLAVRRYAKDKSVLDLFCNSGGFSLNAAIVANDVTAVDISEKALNDVKINAELNYLDNITTLQGDVFDIMRSLRASKKRFGAVILDPPAFCKSAAEIKDAYRGYRDINLQAMKLVENNGYLITCSCSHYMRLEMFERAIAEAAKASGRRVRTLEIKTQSPDHPSLTCADETSYLKFIALQISDR